MLSEMNGNKSYRIGDIIFKLQFAIKTGKQWWKAILTPLNKEYPYKENMFDKAVG